MRDASGNLSTKCISKNKTGPTLSKSSSDQKMVNGVKGKSQVPKLATSMRMALKA